jgi:hypothetical protein
MSKIRKCIFHRVGRAPSAPLRHDASLGRAGGQCPPYADARGAMEALITHMLHPRLGNGLDDHSCKPPSDEDLWK